MASSVRERRPVRPSQAAPVPSNSSAARLHSDTPVNLLQGRSTAGLLDARSVLAFQRAVGNQAVLRLFASRQSCPPASAATALQGQNGLLQRQPGVRGSATAMLELLEDSDGDFDDDFDDEEIDDEAAKYLVTGNRRPPTVWDFVPEEIKADERRNAFIMHHMITSQKRTTAQEVAKIRKKKGSVLKLVRAREALKEFGHYGDKRSLESFRRQQQLEEQRERAKVGEDKKGSVRSTAAAMDKEREERIAAAKLLEEAKKKAEEEEARRQLEEAQRLETEQRQKEQREKADIQSELQNLLQMNVIGRGHVDGWTKLSLTERRDLIDDTWQRSTPTKEEIEKWVFGRKKQIKKGSAKEKEQKAREQIPTFLADMRKVAIAESFKTAKGLVDAAILQEKQADLATDRQLLIRAIRQRGATGDVEALLLRAISELTLSAGTDATVEKGYSLLVISSACSHWKQLRQTQVGARSVSSQLNIIENIWSPGEANEIYWKERGQNYERTKNLMATVGNATVNIHIRPGRWTWPKRRGAPPTGD